VTGCEPLAVHGQERGRERLQRKIERDLGLAGTTHEVGDDDVSIAPVEARERVGVARRRRTKTRRRSADARAS
jgi:hypothetical protein